MILTNLDLPPPKAWLQLGGLEHLTWVTVCKDSYLFVLNYPTRHNEQWSSKHPPDLFSMVYWNTYRLTYFCVDPLAYLRYVRKPVNRFQTHLRWNQTHKRFEPIR